MRLFVATFALVFTLSAKPAEVDFADPFVLREGDTYWAFATDSGGKHVQVATSRDLTTWTPLPDALPSLPAWASSKPGLTWAPTVLRRESAYVLFYTTRDAQTDLQCVARATGSRPEGPYVDRSARPLVCQADLCGSIDPSPFVATDGRVYLLWKSDENHVRCHGSPRIWAQELTADGLDLVGAPVALLGTDRAWEGPLVEGPSMTLRAGVHYLFYSANWYESANYAVGYATCASPLGPCTKMTTSGPLLASDAELLGPGGQEPFDDPSGNLWLAFHAWSAPRATYADGGVRALRLKRLALP